MRIGVVCEGPTDTHAIVCFLACVIDNPIAGSHRISFRFNPMRTIRDHPAYGPLSIARNHVLCFSTHYHPSQTVMA